MNKRRERTAVLCPCPFVINERTAPPTARPATGSPSSADPALPPPASYFAFSSPDEFPVALALDLLRSSCSRPRSPARVPVGSMHDVRYCTHCAPHSHDSAVILPGDRHFIQCGHGVRLSGTCHDPAVATLARILTASLSSVWLCHRDLSGTDGGPGHDQAMRAFMQGPGATLRHTPDLVHVGYHGRGSYLLIEVKTFDAMCPAHPCERGPASEEPRRRRWDGRC